MSVDLLCVDPGQVAHFWPYAGSMIRVAIERTGLNSFDDIEKDVLSGDQLLWLAVSDHIEAAATTQLANGACIVTACSGHQRERWLPLFAKIEAYAKAEGVEKMRIFGRKGWERVLDGYQVEYVVLEKTL